MQETTFNWGCSKDGWITRQMKTYTINKRGDKFHVFKSISQCKRGDKIYVAQWTATQCPNCLRVSVHYWFLLNDTPWYFKALIDGHVYVTRHKNQDDIEVHFNLADCFTSKEDAKKVCEIRNRPFQVVARDKCDNVKSMKRIYNTKKR